MPNFLCPLDLVLALEHPIDLGPQDGIALDTWRGCLGIVTLFDVIAICRWGNRRSSPGLNRWSLRQLTLQIGSPP